MIVTWKIALRIAVILFFTVIVQVSFFAYLTFFGSAPDVVSVVVISLGLLGGAVVGAVCGFATGLLIDSLLLQTLGVSALVLLTAGYLGGRYREGFDISNSLIPPLLIGGLTLLGAGGFAAVELMLGVDTPVSLLVLREIVVKGLLAVLLAVPIYPLVRRMVRPALVDDGQRSRVLARGLSRGTIRARRGRVSRGLV
jgi:rod shape-determining protein MreD